MDSSANPFSWDKLSNFAILPIIFLMKYIDTTDPTSIFYIRAFYGFSQILIISILAYLYLQISANTDKTRVIGEERKFGQPAVKIDESVKEYDMAQLKKVATQQIMGMVITTFLVFKFDLVQPLILQSILNPKTILTHPLFSIYVLGKPAEGSRKRPFKEESPFGALGQLMQAPSAEGESDNQQATNTTTTPAVEAAESSQSNTSSSSAKKKRVGKDN
eukprot:TRINITY_DN927_c0_g1_i1.p1 TRINITY_DN927_c0_g1~~TRINITY_DN927_c0_g1_i1.p1  ORF type:complete len:218 (-),score=53.01 TRINITY_DN927_c0_g1_i1:53-706(-)